MNQTLINQIIDLLKGLFFALASLGVGAGTAYVRKRYSTEQIASAINLAHTAVTATEQLAGIGGWTSAMKFDRAATMLTTLAAKAGITITPEQAKPLIESAVHAVNQAQDALVTPAAVVTAT